MTAQEHRDEAARIIKAGMKSFGPDPTALGHANYHMQCALYEQQRELAAQKETV